jgi:hypothetical protein
MREGYLEGISLKEMKESARGKRRKKEEGAGAWWLPRYLFRHEGRSSFALGEDGGSTRPLFFVQNGNLVTGRER